MWDFFKINQSNFVDAIYLKNNNTPNYCEIHKPTPRKSRNHYCLTQAYFDVRIHQQKIFKKN